MSVFDILPQNATDQLSSWISGSNVNAVSIAAVNSSAVVAKMYNSRTVLMDTLVFETTVDPKEFFGEIENSNDNTFSDDSRHSDNDILDENGRLDDNGRITGCTGEYRGSLHEDKSLEKDSNLEKRGKCSLSPCWQDHGCSSGCKCVAFFYPGLSLYLRKYCFERS